jgi:energy-coupling factor transport system permease protein
MPALSFKFSESTTGFLKITPESRLILTLVASIFSLIFGQIIPLAILFLVTAVYISLEIRFRYIAIVYLFFTFIALTAVTFVWLLGFVFTVLKDQPLSTAIIPFMRLSISINAIIPLAFNSKLSELISTLNKLRLPGLIKLPLIITIRFIPTFINDLKQLRQAVRIRFRGVNGYGFWLLRPFLWSRVFFMPLVVRLIRSTDELALAAELKGLSAETDFGAQHFIFGPTDKIVLALATIAVSVSFIIENLHAYG